MDCRHLYHTLAALKRIPASLVAPFPNSEQAYLPSSNHTYTKSLPNHIHHHNAPCNIHTPSRQLHPHTHHIVTPGFVDRPRWSARATGQMEICWLVEQMRDNRTPPTNKGQGSGEIQQQQFACLNDLTVPPLVGCCCYNHTL